MTIDPFFLPRMFPVANPPQPRTDWALFLDLDGTLLDLAPTPDAVTVPSDLVETLRRASAALNGALAIVSGRLMSEMDALLSPLRLPGGAEHGAVVRMPDGLLDEIDATIPFEWVQALIDAARVMPGVLIERKTHSVVAHFRRAPQRAAELREIARSLVRSRTGFSILEAKMAVEIRVTGVTKARAVDRLMTAAPFAGRTAVFVGDDITDIDGFRAAERMNGMGLGVFERFAGRPSEVRHWLGFLAGD
jgi:trehalose 6-phosphate phosphatase